MKAVGSSVKKVRMSDSSVNRTSDVLRHAAPARAPNARKSTALSPTAQRLNRLPSSGAKSAVTCSPSRPGKTPGFAACRKDGSTQTISKETGDTSVNGIFKNVIIPESTLDLFFQHFNSLQEKFERIEATLSSGSPASGGSAPQSVEAERDADLKDRIDVLEALVVRQSSQLDELRLDRRQLLEENARLSEHIRKIDANLEHLVNNVQGASRDKCPLAISESAESCVSDSPRSSETESPIFSERREVVLHGLFKCAEVPVSTLNDVVFAALSTLCPDLGKEEVVGVRLMPSGGRVTRSEDSSSSGGATDRNASKLPSCVVTLADSRVVHGIMRAKRAVRNNYYTTKDVNGALLSPEQASYMPDRKILINEMLSRESFELFKNLRPIARSLGFKYVWHAGGRFLARRKGGERAHLFKSAADLHALASTLSPVRSGAERGSEAARLTREDRQRENKTTHSVDDQI